MSEEIVLSNFINGEFKPPISGQYIDSFNPATGNVHAKVPDSDKRDVDIAVEAAKTSYASWSETSPQYRSRILLKIAEAIETKMEELARMESQDQGKPVTLARTIDVPKAANSFRFFATSILHERNESSTQKLPTEAFNFTLREPVGVVALITPWNLPLYLLAWKIAPAVACGNTCVCKPSEITSVTAWMLCDIMKKAGLPDGVVNIVFGYGPKAGEAILTHSDVRAVSFTGSDVIAQRIQLLTAPTIKKLCLECGGKNAAIVFADADLEKSVETSVKSSFANQGELCLSTSRIFVQKEAFTKFLAMFLENMNRLTVGDPEQKATIIGALVSKQHMEKVKSYVNIAETKPGAEVYPIQDDQVLLPEKCKYGYFVKPTVITGVDDSSPLMQDEIFGPVTCIVPFEDEAEVIARVNNVKYGLCATMWTRDVSRVHRLSRKLDVGIVWVNCWLVRDSCSPFGGVKLSGTGREGQRDSFEFYTVTRNVCIKY